MAFHPSLLEPILSFIIVLGYHVWLVYSVIAAPESTVIGLTRNARRKWCYVIAQKKDGVLCVQTLRNWLMASSLLATVSVSLVVGLAAFMGQRSRMSAFPETDDGVRVKWKIIILMSCFASSFFCFTQSMRYFIHVGFFATAAFALPPQFPPYNPLTHGPVSLPNANGDSAYSEANGNGVAVEEGEDSLSRDVRTLASLLNLGGLFHTLGLRGFYLTFPVILWLFGQWLLLASTIVLVMVLVMLDVNFAFFYGRRGRIRI
ncbi:uncharacterized protein SPPG_04149 [Spizellomyces punctatus DAOM BR117]|uniref:Uncharacterized protein n=1 Tax=Spizellomyces punctatus (strain DAOM BR117) TaxID=645134 RepID=A0A0L0HIX7_SPIPD|nr:uncharacterized protein SPPG_04149 [Spizellomyces punctatus DAOM BR117]KND01057.1 hypothetical protein SPPG_04149 [Spizellomyces punctatus DAOM BR117]|eukprot:XP_016609096.1 hypothetical protein SPPG_04149 [Spizellomyces punctatus DAOM BR117]